MVLLPVILLSTKIQQRWLYHLGFTLPIELGFIAVWGHGGVATIAEHTGLGKGREQNDSR